MKLYAERTGLWRKFIALFSRPSSQVKTSLITLTGRTKNGHDVFIRVLRHEKIDNIIQMQDQLRQDLNLTKCRIINIQQVTVSIELPETNPTPTPIQKLQYIALQ